MQKLVSLFIIAIAVLPLNYYASINQEINTVMGHITVKVPVKRVITLEHRYTEMVLSLGVIPIGVADIKSYQEYDGVDEKKLKGVESVGRRAAPNLELIASLKPDLIIGAKLRNASVYPVLSSISPSLLFNYIQMPNGKEQPLARLFAEFNTIAKLLGKTQQAKKIIANYNKTVTEAKATINQLKQQGLLKSDRVAIAQFLPGSPKLRLLTTDSVAIEVLKSMGLKAAWPVKGGPSTLGYRTVGIQRLSTLGQTNVFYFNERADDSYLKNTLSNPLWLNLPFVKSALTYRFSQQIWPWGGPVALEKFINEVVDNFKQKSQEYVTNAA
ncbi:Ferric-citrate-binding protein [Piscirickettsia salmonis]|uniref:ABC transporter substrate-binding protein n=1 Tax=Piscirickettsia salmonis TaxID=1238 RepID=UPI001E64400B|nr:iron-siderophore ABC transporter substrate-binding protein [Piscirickettsia salmonis]QGP50002.1 Ferric-citrate-binding protein [Piscirickettsia salmonis]QGP54889.1 Ferric-citrate-binding protein [Piscirickettsia salmonis]QGP59223.1 Ferric-citrate-binding protein [Piscirickettsia salmonis]QGP63921.1 Ferric-citrate-binding protein [Piscirickettsia salmonis]